MSALSQIPARGLERDPVTGPGGRAGDGGGTPAPARRRFPRPDYWSGVGLPGLLFVIAAFAVPMVVVVVKSLTDPSPENYAAIFSSAVYQRSVWDTLRMALVVTGLCLLIGYPYAYAMARSGRAMRTFLTVALMLAFWTSLLVRTYAWQIILNDTGIVNTVLREWLGLVSEPVRLIRTPFAVYIGMVHVLMPYAVLALFAQLRSIDPDVERAARGMGARPWRVFARVTLPLSLPGAVAGGVLVFVLALGFYITPQLLGGARQIYVGQAIMQQIEQFLKPGVGAAMAVLLFAAVLAVLAVAARFVGLGRILGVGMGRRR
ncbi:putative spermidine/putrescine transport system permease protein [Thermocatellispora tengchongensis]|uniref:Putative spermidine/putrescine transport system permease protein n=1 Tax=Thermocatellispora tengchongensis TaxID=1073253 RepID=A0A840P2C7_9ACTN|nr:ABC transporter permease [Thermocatellispora tengchongensis]MBB5135434.1 putative spermidine/putrescine transport system permease protein [Thermocatellispora tengchongensis]